MDLYIYANDSGVHGPTDWHRGLNFGLGLRLSFVLDSLAWFKP